ncbi:YveK family protein [Weissella cibaria]|uniref:hypothetical protein n=1 Tax=Weissella cibaria TaxID=137591 RepID=UPI001897E442|nr:hypothetical protein [Weissella cibaria]
MDFLMLTKSVCKIIIKKWYVTILIPVLVAGIAGALSFKYYQNHKQYTAEATFAIVTKGLGDRNLAEVQQKSLNQEYDESNAETMVNLVTSTPNLISAWNLANKDMDYSRSELIYKKAKALKYVVGIEDSVGSLIYKVKVKGNTRTWAKNYANSLIKSARKLEKEKWKTSSITVLESAALPLGPDTHRRDIGKHAILGFLTAFFIMIVIILSKSNISISSKDM